MKPVILIQTDFSLSWSAVAQMKGVMKQVDPELEIVDLCHDIKTFDPWEASLSLQATEPYWPKGTIFVSVVDPGVGTARRACAARLKDGMIIITPDNGSLTHLLHSVGVEQVREIDESINRYPAKEQVSVFHGRDLFGYCAARLAAGVISFEEVGPEYPVSEIVECEEYRIEPVVRNHYAQGFILTGVKHFGGISLNVTNQDFQNTAISYGDNAEVTITYQGRTCFHQTMPFVHSFGEVPKGAALLYEGSSGYLSIDLNQGNFMEEYEIGCGKDWTVTIQKGE